jgi:hypothetical protein
MFAKQSAPFCTTLLRKTVPGLAVQGKPWRAAPPHYRRIAALPPDA